jgi:hypothetical protein
MNWRVVPLLAAIGLVAACATTRTGPSGGAAAPSDARSVVTEASVRALLFTLAADSMEGRGTATVGGARAARYIAEQMRHAGIEPAGDSGYFQRVPLRMTSVERVGRDSVRRTVQSFSLLRSMADLDTLPAARRRIAVNVVGIIRGTDPVLRDSAVLVDAHYDHLGMRSPGVNGDTIYNGADDDASGTVAVLEIAKAIAAGPRPKRTIIFAATTGEETGLLGTRYYIAHPVVPLARMTANLEIEMIGRPDSLAGGRGRGWLTGFERSTMGAMFKAAGLAIVPDARPDQSFFTRSDNIAFARAGIPAHTLSSFNLHNDYHQPSDEASKADIPHMTAVIRSAVAAVRLLADGPAPQWNPGGKP